MSLINTAEMQVNQIARLMDTITIVKLNDSEFILARKGDKIKRGELPFNTDVVLLGTSDLEQAIIEADHNNDFMSLMYSEMIRTKIIPEIERKEAEISYVQCYADNGIEY